MTMPIDLSEVINDPDFCQPFTIFRSSGEFVLGGFQDTLTEIQFYGVVQVANEKELDMIPEGDKIKGAMVFYSTQAFVLTHIEAPEGVSDIAYWPVDGQKYKLFQDANWSVNGFHKAVGSRVQGA